MAQQGVVTRGRNRRQGTLETLRVFGQEQRQIRASFAEELGFIPGRNRGAQPVHRTPSTETPSILPAVLPTLPLEERAGTLQIVETSVKGSATMEAIKDLRYSDAAYCSQHMSGHAVRIDLELLLRTSGGEGMEVEFNTREEAAMVSGKAQKLRRAVEVAFVEESKTSGKEPANLLIDNRYWLGQLASSAGLSSDPAECLLDYYEGASNILPFETGYETKRKYDAMLRATAAAGPTISNCFVNVEYTTQDPPNSAHNPFVGTSPGYVKSQQTITNANNILTIQSTRSHVLSLSFHGKVETKAGVTLQVFMLSPERVDVAIVRDAFGENITRVAALLATLRNASIYQLGLCPLFDYSLTDHDDPGKITPTTLHLPALGDDFPSRTIEIDAEGRLSQLRSQPFGRSTVVLPGRIEQALVVAKFAYIADNRLWWELDKTESLFVNGDEPPEYAVGAIGAYASPRRLPEVRSTDGDGDGDAEGREAIPTGRNEVSRFISRHLEIIVFDSSHDARPFDQAPSPSVFVDGLISLFKAIVDAFDRWIIHGDISLLNALLTPEGILYLIDWEVARKYGEQSTGGVVTGTLDTMSIRRLQNLQHPLPHDDLESAIYVAIKVLTQTFVPDPADAASSNAYRLLLKWNDGSVTMAELAITRRDMWNFRSDDYDMYRELERMQRADPLRAALLEALLSTPILVERTSLLKSLEVKEDQGACREEKWELVRSSLKLLVTDLVERMEEVKKKNVDQMKWHK
ncbi:Pkinase-fungal domain-containing protein [Pseudohyphozyma bogoriensis]|nr:Pkinase-fungal domain-containing protein [Pseudohyphozyma bogoriensis]